MILGVMAMREHVVMSAQRAPWGVQDLEETWVQWDHQELQVKLARLEQMVHQDSRDLPDRSDYLGNLAKLAL